MAVVDLAEGKRRSGLASLIDVCAGLDETNLSKDEKGYLRLYALYRAIEASKDGRAPAELRAHAEDFRFDQTLVSSWLKQRFPLKKVEVNGPPPPPMTRRRARVSAALPSRRDAGGHSCAGLLIKARI
jgi:hypothetical protein